MQISIQLDDEHAQKLAHRVHLVSFPKSLPSMD